jgi:DNA-binding response OmpR family regulator
MQAVLIVEDDFVIAEDLRQTVYGLGWKVIGPVATVVAALELVRTEHPTMAILDMQVADGSIAPVANLLRALGTVFLAVSGHTDLVALGGTDFIGVSHVPKPFTSDGLRFALETVARDIVQT